MTLVVGIILILAGLASMAGAIVAEGPAFVYAVGGVVALVCGCELTHAAAVVIRERRRARRRGGYLHH
jgi:uncharacterized membrane protein